MSSPDVLGESSCKRKENGDEMDAGRPLKKARFAWQVKGKYHLKNEHEESTSGFKMLPQNLPTESDEEDSDDTSSESSLEKANFSTSEQNLEMLGDYLLKQEFSWLNGTTRSRMRTNSDSVMVPVSMVKYDRTDAEDEALARWQAKQMAKGFVDNAINRVLDSWLTSPFSINEDTNNPDLDVGEFLDNLPGRNNVENEGILMAISAHGLQNNIINNHNNLNNNIDTSNSSNQENLPVRSESTSVEKPCTCSHATRNAIQTQERTPLIPFHRRYSNANQAQSSTTKRDNNEKCEENSTNASEQGYKQENDNNMMFTHEYEFMDTAVLFAIQDKGLTSFGNEFG